MRCLARYPQVTIGNSGTCDRLSSLKPRGTSTQNTADGRITLGNPRTMGSVRRSSSNLLARPKVPTSMSLRGAVAHDARDSSLGARVIIGRRGLEGANKGNKTVLD